jgi:hypothetical protein
MCADITYPMSESAIIPVVNPQQATTSALTLTASTPSLGIATFTTLSDACLGVGVNEHNNEASITLFPVPAQNEVTISFPSGEEYTFQGVTDLSGRSVNVNVSKVANGLLQLQTGNLNSGIYFVDLLQNQIPVKKKFMIAK